MRRYLPLFIVAAVGLLALETGTPLKARERVASDKRRGTALGIHSAPTIFINNRPISAPIVVGTLRTSIDAALKPQPAP